MKFIICRTSRYFDEENPPYPGATWVTPNIHRDIRPGYTSLDEFRKNFPERFEGDVVVGLTSKGRPFVEHKACSGFWVIDIPDILKFVEESGERIIILGPSEEWPEYPGLFNLEIYDDYRE